MKLNILAAASIAATLVLAACSNEPEVIDQNPPDPQAEALKNAAPVQLPPAIRESKTYRCRDNSVVYVNVLTDGTVNVRSAEDEPPTATLRPESPGGPLTGNGYSLSGTGDTVTFSSPDIPAQTCRA